MTWGKDEVVGLNTTFPDQHYALELAERGYVTIAPDAPGHGERKNCDPYATGYASHAVFDPRIKVIVQSCRFTSCPKYAGTWGDLSRWSAFGTAGSLVTPRVSFFYNNMPARMPFDFTELISALAPRPFFLNSPLHDDIFDKSGVDDCLRAAAPVYNLWGAREKLVAVHPDCRHSFPLTIHEQAYKFVDEVLQHKPCEYPGVASSNNAAERAIRPAVIIRKVSGGTRSAGGSQIKTRLMSVFPTWALQGKEPIQVCFQMIVAALSQPADCQC